jgi:hypothetical protein
MATRTEREDYHVWRRVPNYTVATQLKTGSYTNRRWTTVRTRPAAEKVVQERQEQGDKVRFGIEHVHVVEESDGIEWL